MQSILKPLKQIVIVLAAALFCSSCAGAYLPVLETSPWHLVSLPTEQTLLDLAFDSSNQHGWIVGKGSALLETLDGGATWEPRSLALGEDKVYNFDSISFSGQEGWIVGEPAIMLHTSDSGQSWSRIELSEKLPGAPNTITALGPNSAEMTTDIGAIYRTSDGGQTWQAMVQEALGVLRNISRSPDGQYVAVSARGNFYSTWHPGLDAWEPHDRTSSRKLQNMGFGPNGKLWLLARGGVMQFSQPDDLETWDDPLNPEFATSWGMLDLAYRTPEEIWVSGGSGNLIRSTDGGQNWEKDREMENVPSNLYKIIFVTPDQGFILGQRGTLLRYQESA